MLQRILPWQFQFPLCVFHLKLTFNELLVPVGAEREGEQQVSAGLTCPAREQAKETRRQQGKTQLSAYEIGGERTCSHLEDSWKILMLNKAGEVEFNLIEVGQRAGEKLQLSAGVSLGLDFVSPS